MVWPFTGLKSRKVWGQSQSAKFRPPSMHRPSHVGRARGSDDSRADSPDLSGLGSGSPPGSESDSQSESGPATGPGARGNSMILACPGCGKGFPSVSALRFHRNSRWLTNSPCQLAGRMGKRPRILAGARAAVADADSGSDAPEERRHHVLGAGPNIDLPAGAAQANPPMAPRDQVRRRQLEVKFKCRRQGEEEREV